MNYVVVHVSYPKSHLCSVHMESCPKLEEKRNLAGFFVKVFDGCPRGLKDAWNYIYDNGWDPDPDICGCL